MILELLTMVTRAGPSSDLHRENPFVSATVNIPEIDGGWVLNLSLTKKIHNGDQCWTTTSLASNQTQTLSLQSSSDTLKINHHQKTGKTLRQNDMDGLKSNQLNQTYRNGNKLEVIFIPSITC